MVVFGNIVGESVYIGLYCCVKSNENRHYVFAVITKEIWSTTWMIILGAVYNVACILDQFFFVFGDTHFYICYCCVVTAKNGRCYFTKNKIRYGFADRSKKRLNEPAIFAVINLICCQFKQSLSEIYVKLRNFYFSGKYCKVVSLYCINRCIAKENFLLKHPQSICGRLSSCYSCCLQSSSGSYSCSVNGTAVGHETADHRGHTAKEAENARHERLMSFEPISLVRRVDSSILLECHRSKYEPYDTGCYCERSDTYAQLLPRRQLHSIPHRLNQGQPSPTRVGGKSLPAWRAAA